MRPTLRMFEGVVEMEPSSTDLDRVRTLWMKYLALCQGSEDDPTTKKLSGPSTWDAYSSRGAISSEQEAVLLSIHELIGSTCPVATPLELAALLWEDQRAWFRDEEPDSDDESDEALAAWDQKDLDFFRRYFYAPRHVVDFSVRLSLAGDISPKVPLGGLRQLELFFDSRRMFLSGVLKDVVSRGGAIEAAGRAVEEVLGSCYALGLVDLRRLMPGARLAPMLFRTFSRDGVLWAPQSDSDDEDDPDELLDPGDDGDVGVAVPEPAARMIRGLAISLKEPESDIERERRRRGELSPEIERRVRPLSGLFGSACERAVELRNAASLLARGATESDLGSTLGITVTCLEALLLEKDAHQDVTARLAEAVAYRLGGTAERRKDLRSEIRRIYRIRSTFTHTGRIEKDVAFSPIRRSIIEVAREILRREIEEFAP